MQRRRTKIVATIGPACSEVETLRKMLKAGVDVLRINFSHATDEVLKTIQFARSLAQELGQPLAVMADLQGPKIRIGCFKRQQITLQDGQKFTLVCKKDGFLGDEKHVTVDYLNLCHELKKGDRLLLNDGLIELSVSDIQPPNIQCDVVEGGTLSDHKGINRKGGGLAACAFTEKDKKDMRLAIAADVDYITLSFVKDAEDVRQIKRHLAKLGNYNAAIIAKIERTEALDRLTDIILESDAIMVARGDLAVEVGAAEVPALQKRIIKQTRYLNKMVITATQMMESMIHLPKPTRAEVSDVANAILDGTDAVMLSAETASGLYPVKVINMVNNICLSAEKHASLLYQVEEDACHYQRADQAVAKATMHVANHFPIGAIIALTESGATAIWMSRMPSAVPIFAISDNEETVRKLSLVSNVFPFYDDYRTISTDKLHEHLISFLKKRQLIKTNTYLLLTRGSTLGQPGGTNCMQIIHAS